MIVLIVYTLLELKCNTLLFVISRIFELDDTLYFKNAIGANFQENISRFIMVQSQLICASKNFLKSSSVILQTLFVEGKYDNLCAMVI
jgi:hypothetical protein